MIRESVIKDSEPQAAQNDVAMVAGRGTIFITAAKAWFMVTGAGINFILPRLLNNEASFGVYGLVVSIVSVINAVIVTGTSQTVSKRVSQEPNKAGAIKSKSLKLQALVGGLVTLGFVLSAPIISAYLNDPGLVDYLRLASLITLSYSFYAVYIGYFNGQKRFLTQAGLDMTYSTLKLILIVLFVWLGFGVAGGVGGFALAAATVLAISAMVAGRDERSGVVRAKELLGFQTPLLLFTLVFNLLQKTDIILIKSLSSVDAEVASKNAGFYTGAINVANITYQVVISITFVIFPLISESTFANDTEKTRSYISNTLRYSLMIMALPAALFSANSEEVLSLIYPDNYRAGGGALAIVAFGMLLFGVLYILTTVISASGRPSVSLAIGFVTLAANAALNWALIPRLGIRGAAMATTVSMLFGVVVAGGYVMSKFKAGMPLLSALRIAISAGVIYFASLLIVTHSKPLILAQLALLGLAYIAALLASRELSAKDLAAIRRVIKV
jgi:polysaccharide transporter, PST family